jgi:hypothetical protein
VIIKEIFINQFLLLRGIMDLEKRISRRDIIASAGKIVGGLALASALPLATFAGESEITALPKGMKELGFELIPSGGTHVLEVPSLEVPGYTPDLEEVPGIGYFTKIDFDPSKRIVTLETSEGESATLEVDVNRGIVKYKNFFRGNAKMKTATYEPDKHVKRWVRKQEEHQVPASMDYDAKSESLVVRKEGVGELYRERVHAPRDIDIRVLLGKYLKITDKLGKKFTEDTIFEKAISENVLLSLNPSGVRDNQVIFHYNIGNMESSFDKLQSFLDNIMVNSIYKQEFDESSRSILVGDKQLTVRGPNRNGDYELTSGKSSIIYNPATQSATLGRSFNLEGIPSKIMSGSVPQGELMVKEDYGERGYRIWSLKINFGNSNPQKSYTSKLVEDNTKK